MSCKNIPGVGGGGVCYWEEKRTKLKTQWSRPRFRNLLFELLSLDVVASAPAEGTAGSCCRAALESRWQRPVICGILAFLLFLLL